MHRHGEVELLQHDFVAAFPLLPRANHAGIVLPGGEDFVSGLEFEAKLSNLKRFAGVPRDGNAFGVGIPYTREPFANVFDSRFQIVPMLADWFLQFSKETPGDE